METVIPVFEAITGDLRDLGIPSKRLQVIIKTYNPASQRRAATQYYIQCSPYASWKDLSVRLYRNVQSNALQLARQYVHLVRGNCGTLYSITCTIYLFEFRWEIHKCKMNILGVNEKIIIV